MRLLGVIDPPASLGTTRPPSEGERGEPCALCLVRFALVSDMETVAALVSSLAWPATVVFGLVLLRRPLRSLLGRVVSYDGPVGKVTFGERLEQLEMLDEKRKLDAADEVRPSHDEAVGSEDELGEPDEFRKLAELAAISPPAAVVMSWQTLEPLLFELSRRAGPDATRHTPPRARPGGFFMTKALSEDGILPGALAATVDGLRRVRNEAVHGNDVKITESEALGYADIAMSAARHLRAIRRERFPDEDEPA